VYGGEIYASAQANYKENNMKSNIIAEQSNELNKLHKITKAKKTTKTIRKTLSLRIVNPINFNKEEFSDLVHQLQYMIAPLYTDASYKLYQKLRDPESRLKRGNEGKIIQQWMTDLVYHPVSDVVCNSMLALGVSMKLQSSYSGNKAWDIKYGRATAPSVLTNKFPLTFIIQNGLKINSENEEFLVNIPFPSYRKIEEDEKVVHEPWRKFVFIKEMKKAYIQLLLSTKTRKKNTEWLKDEGTEAEIQRVMDGTYKVTTFEIIQRDENWYIHLSINYEQEPKKLDKKKIVGIHAGIARPLTCVIRENKYRSLSIHPNSVIAMTEKQLNRIKDQRIGNKYRKGGHGKKHKLTGTEGLAVDYRQRRKKVIEEWLHLVVDFCLNNDIGTVHLEDTTSKNSFLAKFKFPVSEILDKLQKNLELKGVIVERKKTYYVMQICSKCGHYNKGFTYLFRKRNKFPRFKCSDCLEVMRPEINAANNVANPDYENILIKFALLKSKI
jgi:hypothetical protein